MSDEAQFNSPSTAIQQRGEPINLTPPVEGTDLRKQALELISDRATTANYNRDSSMDTNAIGSPDLRRQVEMKRLQEKDEAGQLERFKTQLKHEDIREGKFDLLDKLMNFTGMMETVEHRKATINAKKDEFIAQVTSQKERLNGIMDIIQNDPQLLEQSITRAYEEAQAVQRIALGKVIRGINGNQEPKPEDVARFVDLYNEGKLHISTSDYKNAESRYEGLVEYVRNGLFGRQISLGESFTQNKADDVKDFFDPTKQVMRG